MNGSATQWYSSYSEASQKTLIQEIGKLCYLVCLMPTRSEYEKGVRTAGGEEISNVGRQVVLHPQSHESVDAESPANEEVNEVRIEEELMDQEEPPLGEGGSESSAAPTTATTTGGSKVPAEWARDVPEGQKLLGLDCIVFHRLDPVQGATRPHGLQNGWHVYNGHNKLACGWSEPPHVAGGRRVACFRDFEPTARLGVVGEVFHSLDFTTALIELTMAAAKVVPGRTHVYVNVWTSRNRSGVR